MSDARSADAACFDARGTEAFDAAGVDVTLIDWMLSLTPRERLQALFEYASSTANCLSVQGPTKTIEVLELFARHQVDFIVVGMTAGVLQGAPAVTFDLDVVYSRAAENVGRLLAAPLRSMLSSALIPSAESRPTNPIS